MIKNLNSLSREELLRRVAELDKENLELNKKNLAQEKKISQQKQTIAQQKQSLKDRTDQVRILQQENRGLNAGLEMYEKTIKEYLSTAKVWLESCRQTFALDISSQSAVLKSLKLLLDKFYKLCQTNQILRKTFEKGTEKLSKNRKEKNKADSKLKKLAQEQDEFFQESCGAIDRELNTLSFLAGVSNSKPGQTEIEKNIRSALGRSPLELQANSPVQSKGRQPLNEDIPDKKLSAGDSAEAAPVCPHCQREMVLMGSRIAKVRALRNKTNDLLVRLEEQKKTYACSCGRVAIVYPKEAQLPVFPGRTISMPLLLEICSMQAAGIPLHKIEELFLKKLQIGGQTLSRNLIDLFNYYLSHIEQGIKERMALNEVIYLDETYFDCLQQQGHGICEKISNPKESSSLILASKSPAGSKLPFAWYGFLPTRSKESIKETLGGNVRPEAIITDGYAGYGSLLKDKEFAKTKRQVCLFHWRRKLVEAVNYEIFEKALDKEKANGTGEQFINGRLEKNDPQLAFIAILREIAAITALENKLVRHNDETDEAFFRRVREARNAPAGSSRFHMDRIDRIIKEVAKDRIQPQKGRYEAVPGKLFAGPCVYYMNNREELRLFLEDPRVCFHTNDVERSIRPLTIIRKNSNFTQSIEGAKNLCGLLSIWETADLCGIKNIVGYLEHFTRELAVHCENNAWSESYSKALKTNGDFKNPNTELKIDWAKLYPEYCKGFDFEKFLPWNYKEQS